MPSSNNINISSRSPLAAPKWFREQLPIPPEVASAVVDARKEISAILTHKSPKFIMIVGPCSIHDPKSALEYATKLAELRREVGEHILIIMRVYFEKPRTTIGWKGLIYDPDLNGSYNIERGIFIARKLLLQIAALGLPIGTEMLDLIIPQYIADVVSWAAIGARTTESQTHRQLASGLSMPVGFKNATDGNYHVALDAIHTARSRHSFIGVTEDGQIGVFRTRGNQYGHVVLRGGTEPNYQAAKIAALKDTLSKTGIDTGVIVDCSHANSAKDHQLQQVALKDVAAQLTAGEKAIVGMMLESNLKPGQQKICPGKKPEAGVSITDACIGWEETEQLIRHLYAVLSRRS